MYLISSAFEFFLRSLDQTWRLKVDIEGVEYGPDEVADFSIEGGLTTGDEFTLGTAHSSRLTLQLRTVVEIPPNAKIIPYVGLSSEGLAWRDAHIPWNQANFPWDGSGGSEWLPLGVFYVDNRKKQNKVWTFECYDGLVFADIAYISELSYPASMQDVWDELCDRAGLEYDDSVQIDPSLTINAGPAGYTCRQVLGYIAGIHGASAVMSRDGKVSWKRFAADDDPVFEFSERDYIRVKQINPVKTYTRLVVTYDTEDQLTYEAGEGDENHTLHLVNPLMTQEMVDALLDQINGLAYVPIEMDARGFPHMELGDVIGYEYTESMAWDEAKIPWQDAHFPWDGKWRYRSIILRQSFGFRGGLSMRIAAPSKSEQQSEFKLEGSLTQQVNRLTQSSVRYDKPYYGVTHSRDEGIVVQREDGKAKAVFNADELSFYADGQHALWFDAPNLRWKFTGTLEGVDGTFSGTVQAGQIIGGRIEGAEIDGGVITGATIQTVATGQRIVLDPLGFTSYDVLGKRRIGITTTGAYGQTGVEFFTNDEFQGAVFAMDDGIGIAGNSILINALYEPLTIYGFVDLTAAFPTGLGISKVDGLSAALSNKADLTYTETRYGVNLVFDPVTRNLKMYNAFGAQIAIVNIP